MPKPKFAYWTSPQALGRRIGSYGVRKGLRMELMGLGVDPTVAYTIGLFLIPMIQEIMQYMVQLEVQKQLDRQEKRRVAMYRDVYRGIISE
jgi:hypothetical protein